MTASLPAERVLRRVADLDEGQEPADLLWIPCAKTPTGGCTLDVPAELRPLMAALAEAKAVDRQLFECRRPPERAAHKPHGRGWVSDQVHRICDPAEVPRVTAHAVRSLLATLTAERALAATSSPRLSAARRSTPRCTPRRARLGEGRCAAARSGGAERRRSGPVEESSMNT
jgi:hypothetical protein